MAVSVSSEEHPGLASARPARAAGPGPGADSLRGAYLELLKLALCDLCGTSTVSVGRTQEGLVMSREMSGDQLRLRAAGMDWPLTGLTMVGLRRLDDLQSCVESVVADGVGGDLIEAGAWRGGASILMRATLDSLGADDRTVWVADSFEGFPLPESDHRGGDELAPYDFLAVPEQEVKESFARFGLDEGVSFAAGFFEETLPALSGRTWAVVRLDGDTYEATKLALGQLYPGLSVGGYMVVDDYGALEECRRAVDEFRSEHGIDDPLEEVDWTGVRWRRQSEARMEPPPPPPVPRRSTRRRESQVPTIRELELEREIADLRARLQRSGGGWLRRFR